MSSPCNTNTSPEVPSPWEEFFHTFLRKANRHDWSEHRLARKMEEALEGNNFYLRVQGEWIQAQGFIDHHDKAVNNNKELAAICYQRGELIRKYQRQIDDMSAIPSKMLKPPVLHRSTQTPEPSCHSTAVQVCPSTKNKGLQKRVAMNDASQQYPQCQAWKVDFATQTDLSVDPTAQGTSSDSCLQADLLDPTIRPFGDEMSTQKPATPTVKDLSISVPCSRPTQDVSIQTVLSESVDQGTQTQLELPNGSCVSQGGAPRGECATGTVQATTQTSGSFKDGQAGSLAGSPICKCERKLSVKFRKDLKVHLLETNDGEHGADSGYTEGVEDELETLAKSMADEAISSAVAILQREQDRSGPFAPDGDLPAYNHDVRNLACSRSNSSRSPGTRSSHQSCAVHDTPGARTFRPSSPRYTSTPKVETNSRYRMATGMSRPATRNGSTSRRVFSGVWFSRSRRGSAPSSSVNITLSGPSLSAPNMSKSLHSESLSYSRAPTSTPGRMPTLRRVHRNVEQSEDYMYCVRFIQSWTAKEKAVPESP